ncbi:DoxX family protein [Sorangium sp. So ce131]|uniref:DoxX family protein n=1 Tax=Sorangium sp. So ce131 TaxID=3133282 RepID=UPI003F63E55D
MLNRFLRVLDQPFAASAALLALRVVAGVAFIFHGFGKIQAPFSWMGPTAPVPGFLQALAALSEFGGGIAWILGLLTPIASLGIASTMAVAVWMHAVVRGDPFFAKGGGGSYEPAAVYLVVALVLFFVGPGRFSADAAIFGRKT